MTPQQSEGGASPSITQDDDPYMSHDNIFNDKAVTYCPPDAQYPNGDPLISFAGHQWWTNFHWSETTGPYVWGGDDPNQPQFGTYFDPYLATASTDGSTATLQIQPPNAASGTSWRTSELCLMDNLGYGRYLVTASTDAPGGFPGLDPNTVFGVFTYQVTDTGDESPNIHREIDATEVLHRSQPGDAQFMLQPYNPDPVPGVFFTLPTDTPVVTVVLSWEVAPKYAYFGLWTGDYDWDGITKYKPFQTWEAQNTEFNNLIPSHRWERFHLNLWLMHGAQPAGPQAVSITRFLFQPYSP